MRFYLFFIASILLCVLAGCGGREDNPEKWEIEEQLCLLNGGFPRLLHVTNVETGEEYFAIQCNYKTVDGETETAYDQTGEPIKAYRI